MRTILALSTLILVMGSPILVTFARQTGAPTGHTGAPAVGGRNCTACHNGTANTGPGGVTIEAHSTFVPGALVPVRVFLTNMQNPNRNGFQLAAYDGSNQILSGWTNVSSDTAVSSNHLNHTRNGNSLSSWVAYFRAPTTATNFGLWGASIDADGNGRDSNDRTYTTNVAMTPGVVNLSISALPRVGSTIALDLHAPSDANKACVVAASMGRSGIPIAGQVIPLSPDPLFVATAQNLLPTLFRRYQQVLDANGRGTAQLAIPATNVLRGLTLHHAFVILDPSRPGGIGTISNPLPITLL